MTQANNSVELETWASADWQWSDPRSFASWGSVAWGALELLDNRVWRTWESSEYGWDNERGNETWADSFISHFTLIANESLGFADKEKKSDTIPISESIKLNSLPTLVQISPGRIAVYEQLPIRSRLSKRLQRPIHENLKIEEKKFAKRIEIHEKQNFGLSDAFARKAKYNLRISESLALQELAFRRVEKRSKETITLRDEYMRRANAVISDMTFFTGAFSDLDFKNFVDVGAPPGYERFRDFIQADYEYQEALFRTVMESSSDDRAILSQMRVDVDVVDVFDRGRGTITSAQASTGITIAFARDFHVAPEITVTMRGGTVIAIPHVVSVTTTGFTVKLLNPANGAGVAGDFTWAAHAY